MFFSFFYLERPTSPSKAQKDSTLSSRQTNSENWSKAYLSSKVDTSISNNLKAFSFNDLKNATKNFRSDSLLGEGGFGCVFKGWIDENTFAPSKPGTGIVVAIKKLKTESSQGHREWLVRVLKISFKLSFVLFITFACSYMK